MQERQTYKVKWDAISISASFICAIHCVLLPIICTSISFWGIEILENPMIEAATISVSMGLGGWAIFHGYTKHHRQKNIVFIFISGIVFLITPFFIRIDLPEMIFKFLGAFLLIIAHIKNWLACKKCVLCNTEKNS
jgi:MerC mercury resistance protein